MTDYRILVNCKSKAIDKIKFDNGDIDWEHPLPDALEKGYWYLITIHAGNDDYIGRIVLGEWKRFGQPQEGARP